MSNQNLETVEKALELLLEDLRVFKDDGKSLYDWSIADFDKYKDILVCVENGDL